MPARLARLCGEITALFPQRQSWLNASMRLPDLRPLAALLAVSTLAACAASSNQEGRRFPTSEDYPPGVMERFSFTGGAAGWRLSALRTPERAAPWKIVVVTGTPSWSEYWAPTLAAAPEGVEVVVADRPGFAQSEPKDAVTDLAAQVAALEPLLEGPEGQKVLLIGQSFGGPISALLAAKRADKVKGLVLMSAFFGERGPTARRLTAIGGAARPLLPRDLRNALDEVRNQAPQLPAARAALASLTIPIVVLHGDADTFVPMQAAQALAEAAPRAALQAVPEGDHFLNACCVSAVLDAAMAAMARADVGDGPAPIQPAGGG